jgi:hypothetical protein
MILYVRLSFSAESAYGENIFNAFFARDAEQQKDVTVSLKWSIKSV